MMSRIATCVMMATVGVFAASASGCTLESSNGPAEETGSTDPATPHCVARVESNEVHCYSTFQEAMAFATGGAITDAPEASVALADDGLTRRIDALATPSGGPIPIGIIYADFNFGGASFTFSAANGCDGNLNTVDFENTNLIPMGWNDKISSFVSFGNCQTVLFEDINFVGATTQKAVFSSNVGIAMNDRTSSIRWF